MSSSTPRKRKKKAELVKPITISLKPSVREAAEERAAMHRSFSAYCVHLIEEDLRLGGPHVLRPAPAKPARSAKVIAFPAPPATRRVPILGTIAAGDGDTAEDTTEFYLELPADLVDGASFGLRVKGDSLDLAPEGIKNGDVVLMALRPAKPGEIVAALIKGATTLKRVKLEKEKPVLCSESSNPTHKKTLPKDEFFVQGVYVATVPKELVAAGRVD